MKLLLYVARRSLSRDSLVKAYLANSCVTFHPEQSLFAEEATWHRRLQQAVRPRNQRFQAAFENVDFNVQVNAKFKRIQDLQSQLREIARVKSKKPDFARKKALRQELLSLREHLLTLWLQLPVAVEADVPLEDDQLVQQFNCQPLAEEASRGGGEDLIDSCAAFMPQVAPGAVFYSGDLANIDSSLKSYLRKLFSSQGFTAVSNPDTLRLPMFVSTLDETVPLDSLDAIEQMTLRGQPSDDVSNSFVLVGGASPQALRASLAKQMFKEKYLPRRVFSLGEMYVFDGAVPRQKSVLSFAMLCHSPQQLSSEFNQVTRVVLDTLQRLHLPFSCANIASQWLKGAESKRLDVCEAPSRLLASMAMHGDIFSRRCEMLASRQGSTDVYRQPHWPLLATGLVDIELVLRCLVERYTSQVLLQRLKV